MGLHSTSVREKQPVLEKREGPHLKGNMHINALIAYVYINYQAFTVIILYIHKYSYCTLIHVVYELSPVTVAFSMMFGSSPLAEDFWILHEWFECVLFLPIIDTLLCCLLPEGLLYLQSSVASV